MGYLRSQASGLGCDGRTSCSDSVGDVVFDGLIMVVVGCTV
jgi:hypothetical protein